MFSGINGYASISEWHRRLLGVSGCVVRRVERGSASSGTGHKEKTKKIDKVV